MTEQAEAKFVRIPGLLRRWEIERVLVTGADFHIEDAGTSPDGTLLFAVYRRGPESPRPELERTSSSPRRREVRR